MWGVVGLKACPFGLEKGHRTRVSVHVLAREKKNDIGEHGKLKQNQTLHHVGQKLYLMTVSFGICSLCLIFFELLSGA